MRQFKGTSLRVWFERSVELLRSVVALKDRDRTQYCISRQRQNTTIYLLAYTGKHLMRGDVCRLMSLFRTTSCKNQLCSPRIKGSSENVIIWTPGSYINLFMFVIYSSFCENMIWSPIRRKSR